MLQKLLFIILLLSIQMSAQTSLKHEIWEDGSWKNLYLYSTNYIDGYVDQELMQQWDNDTNAWVNHQQTLYTYPTPFLQTNTLTQTWNTPTQVWTDLYRTTKITTVGSTTVKEIWNGSAWINAERHEYVINLPESTTNTYQIWSEVQWVNSHRSVQNNYPENGGREIVEQIWNGSVWDNATRNEIINTEDQTEELNQIWETGQWANLSLMLTETEGSTLIALHFVWENADWALEGRTTETTVNGDHHILYESYDDAMQQYAPENQSFADWSGEYIVTTFQNYISEWVNDYRLTEYFPGILSTHKPQAISVSVFPIPAESSITVSASQSIKSYQLYALDGKLIDAGNPNTDVFDVDVSSLSRGVYILKVGATVLRIFKH